ncbi:MAG: DUF2149 domain-containing protein [Clostridiales Family XIII bacterium]|jgi:hypothetical protein|nr:DUF2149 domain-containing protein [Clostridiales Family XIII bacterium]
MLRSNYRSRKRYFDEEDVNPMEGAVNIVDAMLVFACGLMLSLVIYWNVDIQNKELVPVSRGQEVSGIESTQEDLQGSIDGEGQYEKMGTVYVDPKTGKMYMVNEDTDGTENEE